MDTKLKDEVGTAVISVQYLYHVQYLPLFKRVYNWKIFLSTSEHQGGAGVSAGGAKRHQEGQVYAASQSGWTEEQHEDGPAAEPATQTGPQTESSKEGNTLNLSLKVVASCHGLRAQCWLQPASLLYFSFLIVSDLDGPLNLTWIVRDMYRGVGIYTWAIKFTIKNDSIKYKKTVKFEQKIPLKIQS